MLIGEIPTSLTNLTNLDSNYTSIGYNALYTDVFDLRAFLDTVDPDWEVTQTVAPDNLQAEPINDTSIRVSWTPILFTGLDGGYRVFFSTTPGGPYTFYGITDNKTYSEMEVTGLNPDTTYYFTVQTRTEPFQLNPNTVDSEPSEEVSARTTRAFAIDKLKPRRCEPREEIKIIGYGFGEAQGDSLVHIGKKSFDWSSARIKLWSATKIRIKVPNYKCKWFKGQDYRKQKVWVTVDGIDSNKKRLKVMKPSTCP
jgi:hypothetical protein